MGYTTRFDGAFRIEPPLTEHQRLILLGFSGEKHEMLEKGGCPGGYCQWQPTKDGAGLEWDGNENFYSFEEWLRFLFKEFLEPWGRRLNGDVTYQGEETGDVGLLSVRDGVVTKKPWEPIREENGYKVSDGWLCECGRFVPGIERPRERCECGRQPTTFEGSHAVFRKRHECAS